MTGAVNYYEKTLKIRFLATDFASPSPVPGDNCPPCPTPYATVVKSKTYSMTWVVH